MVDRTRTYSPSDWTLWVYTADENVFRWDFSVWDGPDVWGTPTQLGSMQPLVSKIFEIDISEGSKLDNSVLGVINPGIMTVNGQLDQWDSSFVNELYNGKKIALTLKNEADHDTITTKDNFGRNTIYFLGVITNSSVEIDPISKIVSYTIEAQDYLGQSLNQLITNKRSIVDPKFAVFNDSIFTAQQLGQIPFDDINFYAYSSSGNTNEFAVDVIETLGEIAKDYLASEVAFLVTYYNHSLYDGNIIAQHVIDLAEINTLLPSRTITDENITSVVMGSDGQDRPTNFDLSNENSKVQYGSNIGNYLSNQITYSKTIDTTVSGLNYVVQKLKDFTPKIQPVQLELVSAITNQKIVFPYDGNVEDYVYPNTRIVISEELTYDSSILLNNYDFQVVGLRHQINTENWITTIDVWKGL